MTRGHRVLPHTADLVIEAWGPNREACLEEAVAALAAAYCEPGDGPPAERAVEVTATDDGELLVRLLDEVVFVLDTAGEVVVAARLEPTPEGVAGTLFTQPIEDVQRHGAPPKAITHHGLTLGHDPSGWRARVTVDV